MHTQERALLLSACHHRVNGGDWYASWRKYGKPLMFGETKSVNRSLSCQNRSPGLVAAMSERPSRKLPAIRAFEYFDSQESPSKPDWHVDAPGSLAGDSGAQAFRGYRAFANSSYLDPLGR